MSALRNTHTFCIGFCILFLAVAGYGQGERFTGTVVAYGSGVNTRVGTTNFTLDIKQFTPPQETQRYLNVLQESGQDRLLDAIKDEDIGYFSVGNGIGTRVNAASEMMVGGKRKIFVVFQRWTQFAEIRGARRSLDYPFGYVELTLNPRTGEGTGK